MDYKQGEINEMVPALALAVGAVAKNAAVAAKKKLVGDKKSKEKKVKPIGTDTVEDNMKYTQGNIEEGWLGNTVAAIQGRRKVKKAVSKSDSSAIGRMHSADAAEKSTKEFGDAKLKSKLNAKASKISKRDEKERKSGKKPGLVKNLARKVTGQSSAAGRKAARQAGVIDRASKRKDGDKPHVPSQTSPGQEGRGKRVNFDNMQYDTATYISEGGTQSAARKLKGVVKAKNKGKASDLDVRKAFTRANNKNVKSKARLAARDAKKAAESDSVNEGSSGIKRLERKARSSGHAKENRGRSMDTTMVKLGKKRGDARKRDSSRTSFPHGRETVARTTKEERREHQKDLSKKSSRKFEKGETKAGNKVWDRNDSSNRRDRPTG